MKYLFVVLFVFISFNLFAQDSLKIKEYEVDKIQIDNNLQKLQTELSSLQADSYRLEGKIDANYEIYKQDTLNVKIKTVLQQLYITYEDIKKKVSEYQTSILKLYGYLEYNQLLLTRELEKFKK